MKVRVSRTSEDVPKEFLCSLLYGFLKSVPQNCEEKLESVGFLELDLTEEEIRSLKEAKLKYPFFNLEVLGLTFKGHQNKTYSIFSESWEFLKANVGFFALFSFILLITLLLSFLPMVGFLFKIVFTLLIYSCILYLVDYFSDRHEGEITVSKVWDYIAPSLGLYLGMTILSLLMLVLSFILLIAFVGFGALIDLAQGKESWKNALLSFGVVILLILVLILYYLYATLLVYAKIKEKGIRN